MAALLTEEIDRLEMAIDALDKGGETSPRLLAVDESSLSIDALPLQRPTAYNLPEGLSSRDVVTRELHDLLEQIFADLKQAYGERAHLYRFDYGTFMEFAENQDVIVLSGEFCGSRGSRDLHLHDGWRAAAPALCLHQPLSLQQGGAHPHS